MSVPPLATLSRPVRIKLIVASLVRIVIGLLVIWTALALLPDTPDRSIQLPIAIIVVGVAFYVWFFRRQLRRIRKSKYPGIQAVETLLLVAAMFLALFAALYVEISLANPNAFTEPLNHFNAYYFALTVLATVGFGDITPVSDPARLASMLQMSIDIAFLAVVLKVVTNTAQSAQRNRQARATLGDTDGGAAPEE